MASGFNWFLQQYPVHIPIDENDHPIYIIQFIRSRSTNVPM